MEIPNEPPPANPPTEASKAPLLPPALKGAPAHLFLWVLPLLLLCLLNLQGYWLIEGNMDESQRWQALWLGIHNVVNLGIGVALFFIVRSKWRTAAPDPAWALVPVLAQIAFLWHATYIAHDLLPDSVTLWIYPQSRFFYNHYAFCMLPLFWGIIRIACGNARFLSKSIGINLLAAVLAPVALYIGIQVMSLFSGWRLFDGSIGLILIISGVVALSVIMFVALIRCLMLLFKNLARWGVTQQVVAICLIALFMPIGGLLLNRSIPFPVDFQAWEVYALVGINTLFLIWAVYQSRSRPRLSFWLLCASFPFTLYFLVVFLPYTPLSILGVIAMGAGFLVLTPTFLFTLHLYQGIQAHRHAARSGHSRGILIGGLIAFLLLPTFFTVRGTLDKSALNRALDFVYTPDYESESITYSGNRANLRRALASHRNYKNGIYYPLLSDYYSWLVFDNLVLPDDKIAKLEQVFFDTLGSTENIDPIAQGLGFWGSRSVRDRSSMPNARPPSREVNVIDQDLQLFPVDEQSTQATLTLTLENVSKNAWGGAEYINKLSVPPGALINGFRLHIEGTPVPGRIFEKKTALWVYTMIRDTERRDPGLLVYNNPQEIELRVFPINKGHPATVEIDFLIPVELAAMTPPDALPDPSELIQLLYPEQVQVAAGENFTYIAPIPASVFPAVEREHYLHFILDRSIANGYEGDLTGATIQSIRARFPDATHARVTLAHYNVVEATDGLTLIDQLKLNKLDMKRILPTAGGFDLDRALTHAIANYTNYTLNQTEALPPEPIFVLLGKARLDTLPELEKARIWQSNLSQLQVYSIGGTASEAKQLTPAAPPPPLFKIGDAIRPAHPRRSLIFPTSEQAPEYYDSSEQTWKALPHAHHAQDSVWAEAIALWVDNHRYAASPGSAPSDLKQLVEQSRTSGVLIPATSYIVVENEAQWRILQKKEGQKLEQHEALDFLETPAPPALWIALGFGGWLLWRKRLTQKR